MAKEVKVKGKFNTVFKVLKSDDDIAVGFSNIDIWADTGVYAINRKLSNRYDRGFLYGRCANIYGESGSGKSLLWALTAANEQRIRDAYIIWIDTENATDDKAGKDWFTQAGVDISEDKFSYIRVITFSKALKVMTTFINDYKKRVKEGEDMPPVIVVFDSYSGLQTDTQFAQNEGKKPLTQDQGQLQRQLGDFVKRINSMVGGYKILIGGVLHVYMNQDEYGARHKTTGGMKVAYIASQALMFTKANLTNEDAEPQEGIVIEKGDEKKVIGIKCKMGVLKSRFSKPFETTAVEVVYPKGIDKYTGLMDLLIDDDKIWSPVQGWYEFKKLDGTTQKFRRREFKKYAADIMALPLDIIINKDDILLNPEELKKQLSLEGEIEELDGPSLIEQIEDELSD